MDWDELRQLAKDRLIERQLPEEYRRRLDKELYEIDKQGANEQWLENYQNKIIWGTNPNGLVFPWLLGMTPVDPIIGINKLMIESEDGKEADAIIMQLSNENEICVSEHTMVKTDKGYIKASELSTGYAIRKERRNLKEVSAETLVLQGVTLKQGPHPIPHIEIYQTDFP